MGERTKSRRRRRKHRKPTENHIVSTRENAAYKWKETSSHVVIGALEIPSEPELHLHEDYEVKDVPGKEDEMKAAYKVWVDLDLRHEFISACENIPVATACCGMVNDHDETLIKMLPILNKGWARSVNDRLMTEGATFRIDVFALHLTNLSCPDTNILLIRFLETGTSVAGTNSTT